MRAILVLIAVAGLFSSCATNGSEGTPAAYDLPKKDLGIHGEVGVTTQSSF